MRANWVLVVGALVAGCQTYDFERVVPFTITQKRDTYEVKARRLKPNVMLLVDNSLSMLRPIDATNPNCALNCGDSVNNPCAASCPTRVSEMKQAMGTFLPAAATTARFAVTAYPTDNVCRPATSIDVPFPAPTANDDGTDATLAAAASAVGARIQMLKPTGGTPTGASLEFLGTYAGLTDPNDGREDYVLVLTDGLPNCNTQSVNQLCGCGNTCTTAQNNACTCTVSTCTNSTFCSLGCLDREGSVDKVEALLEKGIKTIVVGFGADLASGDGPAVLNAMALAGGFPRGCPEGTDAECGGAPGSCNSFTKQCSTAFYQAANGTELADVLATIGGRFPGNPCAYELSESPSNPQYLAVVLNDETLLPGADTYRYLADINTVEFLGATCRRLESTTPQNPLRLEFRIVQAL